MSGTTFPIGELSSKTGVKVPTIRYYEQIGLIPDAERTAGHQRRYSQLEARRLMFIRHARDLGFSIDHIRELLDLAGHPDQPCAKIDRIARLRAKEIGQRIARLEALKSELWRVIKRCKGGRIAECRIIEALADLP